MNNVLDLFGLLFYLCQKIKGDHIYPMFTIKVDQKYFHEI